MRIHQFLYDITNAGSNIPLAQHIYALLYLATFIISCSIYRSVGNIPNWVILLLPLSKRLHSIFVLRLFNDCWSVLAVQAAILAFQHNYYDTGILLFRWVLNPILNPNNSSSVSVLVPRYQSKCPFCSIFRVFWSSYSNAKDCFLP